MASKASPSRRGNKAVPAAPVVSVIMGGAGGAAHLAGATAAQTPFPVLRTPGGVQMPGGIPVGTLAVGSAGAKRASLPAFCEPMKRKAGEETLP